ncbi:MAG: amidohydrolase family protein, partial [Candidatus Hodarchaeota archaeon]
MIIDIHHHVGGYKPPIDVRTRTRLKISRIDPDDQYRSLIKQMDKNGIDITGIMGPYDHDQMKKYSNRFFGISMFENYPKPNIEKIEYDVTTLGLKALKMLPDLSGPPGYAGERKRGSFDPKDKIMDPVYKKVIDLDIPTWWHAVESLRDVIIKYPELKVVIAHLGDKAGDPIELCKTYPNVYIEASAITAT